MAALRSFVFVFPLLCSALSSNVVEYRVALSDLKSRRTERAVTVRKGDTLLVKLESQATGYIWQLDSSDAKALALEGRPTYERTENKPGAIEYKVFRFSVAASGSATFVLARPFDKETKAKTLVLKAMMRPE